MKIRYLGCNPRDPHEREERRTTYLLEDHMAYTGAYYSIKAHLIKTGALHAHTGRLSRPVPDSVLGAVNSIQRTPWRVNGFVLDTMRECWDKGVEVSGLPPREDQPLPARLPAEVWDAMEVPERARHKAEVAMVHGENAGLVGQREEIARRLKLAGDLGDRAFWFPHALDFRSRVYPLPQDLHPQGDDTAKALLEFKRGKVLTPSGLEWLQIGVANAFGHDKLSLEERRKWVDEHHGDIVDSVERPLRGRGLWMTAADPWTFLAQARSLVSGGLIHTPMHIDATCSGVQHLSALGLDEVGGRATNLTDTGRREDLYSEVALAVSKIVTADALRGVPQALAWAGKVTRSTVKRAVMTTPYGVTPRGIRDQLLGDKLCSGLDVRAVDAADYMRDRIIEALETTVVAARQVMAWLQSVAKALADAELPFRWITPAGVEVQQAYYKVAVRRVTTLYGRVSLQAEDTEMGLDVGKAGSSAAPNFVHSFDAAHLTLTVNALRGRGIEDFALIHDSFGTHPCNVATMGEVLRETFVSMYSVDRLSALREYVMSYAPGVEIPEPPQRGTLDLSAVRKSRYFFS